MANDKKFHLILKKRREGLGLSQSELGERLGCTSQYVSNWERSTCEPPFRILKRLAYILDLDEHEVVYGWVRSKKNRWESRLKDRVG